MSRKIYIAALGLSLLLATSAFACLWDSDTLQMERLRFPGVLEIITGKFVRHSKAYYEWRIDDRQKKLETKPNDPALIDDLAVAYAKLGRPEEGILPLEEVLKDHPDRYETLSNLGTLLFFAGRLDDSKSYIRRALEINPDAHFGREKYQLLLTEYFQQSEYAKTGMMSSASRSSEENGFWSYIKQSTLSEKQSTARRGEAYSRELKKATIGILGMMHFADFESPILLEALGDVMAASDDQPHAAMAYLRAAHFSQNEFARTRFKEIAAAMLTNRDGPKLYDVEVRLRDWVKHAQGEFSDIEQNERRWIEEGRDVDQEFAAFYYDSVEAAIAAVADELKPAGAAVPIASINLENTWAAPIAGIVLAIGLVIFVAYFKIKSRSHAIEST